MSFLNDIEKKAKKIKNKRIAFPESLEPRTLKAIERINKNKLAKPVLFLHDNEIKKVSHLDVDIISLDDIPEKYINHLYEKRKHKGLSLEQARNLIKDPVYLATIMLDLDELHGLISGAIHSTANTIRPALQIIKTQENISKVSGVMFMETIKGIFLFSDIAINPDPNPQELAEISYLSCKTAKSFGFDPKIAMLSFSSKGSAKHPLVDKVIKATKIAKELLKNEDCVIDGELQVDSALVERVAKIKCKDCDIQGDANVLIFPDLNAGNIGYKLVERLGEAKAIGPLIQGLRKPVNDLSRGCNSDDIYYLTALTLIQIKQLNS